MNYTECLRYLEDVQNLGIKFGLENVLEVLSDFGHPEQSYPSVLVGGTNGKGSVCGMLNRILTLQGFRAGMFTSPHLVDVEERIRIGEALIPRRSFSRLLTRVREKVEALIAQKRLLTPPTYFEHMCCLAFLYFAQEEVDIALLEVGMGGRFDATNVVVPKVSVITTISPEHQKYLGETPAQIAFEKAGIIKPGVPVVCGVEDEEAYEVLRSKAREVGAPFFGVLKEHGELRSQKTPDGFVFTFRMDEETFAFKPGLLGGHQGRNAAVAIAAAKILAEQGFPIGKDQILKGVETATWEGRLEVVSQSPLVLLDGAHNEEGAVALKRYVEDFTPEPRVLVYGAMRDKNIEKIAEILFPVAESIILTRFPYHRAADPEDILERVSGHGRALLCERDARQAYRLGLRLCPQNGTVVVSGSLFLVGEVKKFLRRKKKHLRETS